MPEINDNKFRYYCVGSEKMLIFVAKALMEQKKIKDYKIQLQRCNKNSFILYTYPKIVRVKIKRKQ